MTKAGKVELSRTKLMCVTKAGQTELSGTNVLDEDLDTELSWTGVCVCVCDEGWTD